MLAGLRGETITTIIVTHTHKDHSPGARAKGRDGSEDR
ncbi:MAG: hypothetical protein M3178_03890 [Pseudomonadota bacterium]|nr:hypothetical protein [Pseudomonadota bacterium]